MIELLCVGVIGTSVVAVAIAEDRLVSKGMFVQSDTMRAIVTALLTTGGIGATTWFLFEMTRRFILNA